MLISFSKYKLTEWESFLFGVYAFGQTLIQQIGKQQANVKKSLKIIFLNKILVFDHIHETRFTKLGFMTIHSLYTPSVYCVLGALYSLHCTEYRVQCTVYSTLSIQDGHLRQIERGRSTKSREVGWTSRQTGRALQPWWS